MAQTPTVDNDNLDRRLRRSIQAEVLLDTYARGHDSMNASAFQIEPIELEHLKSDAGASNFRYSAETYRLRGKQRDTNSCAFSLGIIRMRDDLT